MEWEEGWNSLISVCRACVHNAIAFLPPSLRDSPLCLDFTKMFNVTQKKTMERYICISYTIISKN